MRRSSSVLSRKVLSKERREMSARAKAWRPDLKVKNCSRDLFFISKKREKGCYIFLLLSCKTTGGEFKKKTAFCLPAFAPPRVLCFII